MSVVLYVRVPDEDSGWLRGQSETSGISLSRLVSALIADARQRQVRFEAPESIIRVAEPT